jgi:enoyl-CoA hydratase/carnithine racemase
MYIYLTELIQKANEDEEVRYIVIQGANGNFSTGNDLGNFTNPLIV